MALVYRNVVGPVKDANGNLLASGGVRAKLASPGVDDGDGAFVVTKEVEVVVTSGAFSLLLGAPGTYTFTVTDEFGATIDSFSAYLAATPLTDITIADLYSTV